MKKLSFIITLFVVAFLVSSCDKEQKDVSACVKIEVKENNVIKPGVTVYMFTEQTGPNTVFFIPFHSRKFVTTDNQGIATFHLNNVDLNISSTQTKLYFGVFDQSDEVLGSVGISVKKDEIKEETINLLVDN